LHHAGLHTKTLEQGECEVDRGIVVEDSAYDLQVAGGKPIISVKGKNVRGVRLPDTSIPGCRQPLVLLMPHDPDVGMRDGLDGFAGPKIGRAVIHYYSFPIVPRLGYDAAKTFRQIFTMIEARNYYRYLFH
jgi:hypothetical protein